MIGNILAGAIESPAAPTKPSTIEIIVQAGGGGGLIGNKLHITIVLENNMQVLAINMM
jgi:hypothetical protein